MAKTSPTRAGRQHRPHAAVGPSCPPSCPRRTPDCANRMSRPPGRRPHPPPGWWCGGPQRSVSLSVNDRAAHRPRHAAGDLDPGGCQLGQLAGVPRLRPRNDIVGPATLAASAAPGKPRGAAATTAAWPAPVWIRMYAAITWHPPGLPGAIQPPLRSWSSPGVGTLPLLRRGQGPRPEPGRDPPGPAPGPGAEVPPPEAGKAWSQARSAHSAGADMVAVMMRRPGHKGLKDRRAVRLVAAAGHARSAY